MKNSNKLPSGNLHHQHSEYDQYPDLIYPYPSIPSSTRPVLERCFDIEDVNIVNPNDAREISRRIELGEVNDVLGLVKTYCGTELCDSAYQAAALGRVEDLSDGLGSYHLHTSIRAREVIGDFFKNNCPKDINPSDDKNNIYIAGLLKDRRRLDQFRQITKSSKSEFDYQAPPTASEWLASPEISSAETLYNLADTINIESILISGAETLLKLSRHANNDRLTLDTIRYSEQIIAPVAEVIGFDTLAMSLNDLTKTIRLKNAGRPDLIIKAKAMLERFRNFDKSHSPAHNTRTVFTDITSTLTNLDANQIHINTPVNYGDDNRSIYGDTPVQNVQTRDDSTVEVSWRFRLKTTGTLAWKLHQTEQSGQDNSFTPMDILGITAVVDDNDAQTKLFQTLANSLYDSNELMEFPAPSKISPIHIRGTTDFINKMSEDLPLTNLDIHETKTIDSMHYGKITGFYRNLPFELQCVTKPYRELMQTGSLAHIIYKANKSYNLTDDEIKRWSTLLAGIRRRRQHLGEPSLIGIPRKMGRGYKTDSSEKLAKTQNFITDCVEASNDIRRTIGFIAEATAMEES